MVERSDLVEGDIAFAEGGFIAEEGANLGEEIAIFGVGVKHVFWIIFVITF